MRFPPADTHLCIAFDRAKKPQPLPDAPLALLAKHSYADADVEIVAAIIVSPTRAPTKKRLITDLPDLSAEKFQMTIPLRF
jgi:hypothetical protein